MVELYCDGLCEPNPRGHATWGLVAFLNAKMIHKDHGYIGRGEGMSNNVAEYRAVYEALAWLYRYQQRGDVPNGPLPATIKTDSQLVVNQVLDRWQVKAAHLVSWAEKCRSGVRHTGANLEWVPRAENEFADAESRCAYFLQVGKQPPHRGKGSKNP